MSHAGENKNYFKNVEYSVQDYNYDVALWLHYHYPLYLLLAKLSPIRTSERTLIYPLY